MVSLHTEVDQRFASLEPKSRPAEPEPTSTRESSPSGRSSIDDKDFDDLYETSHTAVQAQSKRRASIIR